MHGLFILAAPQLIVKNIQYSGSSIERDGCKTHHRPILVTSEHTREQSTHIQVFITGNHGN